MSDFSTTRKMSLMKILKSKGPNIEPWGIPRMTLAQPLYAEPILSSVYGNLDNHLLTVNLF